MDNTNIIEAKNNISRAIEILEKERDLTTNEAEKLHIQMVINKLCYIIEARCFN